MKKVFLLVTSFCFLAVSSVMSQKTEIKETTEIKKVEPTPAKASEKQPVREEKAKTKIVTSDKEAEIKKIDSSRKTEATKVQKAVVPAKKREEVKEK
jgi:hypothetical protein